MLSSEGEEALRQAIDLGHLSAGVGHHVINAFSAVVSNAELLRLDPPIPSIANPAVLAETIIRTALEASNVARRLIDYTRPVTSIGAPRTTFAPEVLALDRFVADYVAARRTNDTDADRSLIRWELELSPLRAIKADPRQLKSMLDYFIDNALESFPQRAGTIRFVTMSDRRGWNVLEVHDDGEGMEPAVLERAVEPFFSTKPGHLGVGLSIANGIWRRHRGTLSIHSRPDAGTKISLAVEPLPHP